MSLRVLRFLWILSLLCILLLPSNGSDYSYEFKCENHHFIYLYLILLLLVFLGLTTDPNTVLNSNIPFGLPSIVSQNPCVF